MSVSVLSMVSVSVSMPHNLQSIQKKFLYELTRYLHIRFKIHDSRSLLATFAFDDNRMGQCCFFLCCVSKDHDLLFCLVSDLLLKASS